MYRSREAQMHKSGRNILELDGEWLKRLERRIREFRIYFVILN
jgi:hypothetical protein